MSATESPAELLERLRRERKTPPPARHFPLAVTGTRKRGPTPEELAAFWRLFDRLGGTELHHGDAQGIDRGVASAARRTRPALKVVAHPAAWTQHGPAAGPIRNQEMLMTCRALVAFPGGVGTANCTRQAQTMGRPVHLIADEVDLQHLKIERDHL
jgi:hypothetical protein